MQRGAALSTALRLTVAACVVALAGCGSHYRARGEWYGTIVEEQHLETLSGTPVAAAALVISNGPPMTADATTGSYPAVGNTALLADARSRVLDPAKFRLGSEACVKGVFRLDFAFDRRGQHLRDRRYGKSAPHMFVLRVRDIRYGASNRARGTGQGDHKG